MSDPARPPAPVWTIHSVAVRFRDGPRRLAQAYQRLLTTPPRRAGHDGAEADSAKPQVRA